MNHLEFAAAESAALEPTEWERWATRVERLLGHSLDGNQADDGYSMDEAFEAWESGDAARVYAYRVATRPDYHPREA